MMIIIVMIILFKKKRKEKKRQKKILPGGESNPGLPRDRRGYLPLYYRGHIMAATRFGYIGVVHNNSTKKKTFAASRVRTCAGKSHWISSPTP